MLDVVVFLNDTATTEIYTLSLHDALPICRDPADRGPDAVQEPQPRPAHHDHLAALAAPGQLHHPGAGDRKSTRLNSSHANISYAVFCLTKKRSWTCSHSMTTDASHIGRAH